MNTRLEQDAADSLVSHEQRAKWRERALTDMARTKDHKIVGTWKPVLTEQQKQEQDRYIAEHKLPF